MLIVGEVINSSKKAIAQAVVNRDSRAIVDIARKQVEAGANLIDINAGTLMEGEPAALCWLTETVQDTLDVSLCLDSPDSKALQAALKVHKGTAMINSITAEKERYNAILPLVQKYNCRVVALCMDDAGMPTDADGRVAIGTKLVQRLEREGISRDRIYLDPLVYPVSTDGVNGPAVLEAIRRLMTEIPGVHTICGLSNISYGLPCRPLLNKAFLLSAMASGMDAAILNPLDTEIMGLLRASDVILNRDCFAMNYITAYREGKLS